MKWLFRAISIFFLGVSAQPALAQQTQYYSQGFYAGVNLGGASSSLRSGSMFAPFTLPPGVVPLFPTNAGAADHPGFHSNKSSLTGGIFVGYNAPISQTVFVGAEADFSLLRLSRSSGVGRSYLSGTVDGCFLGPIDPMSVCTQAPLSFELNEQHRLTVQQFGLATLRGRVGYSFGATAVYITAGLAGSQLETSIASNSMISNQRLGFAFEQPPRIVGNVIRADAFSSIKSRIAIGFTGGLGAEHQLTNNLRLRAEYLYYDFGAQRITYSNGAQHKVGVNGHLARLGLVWGR